jgi:hypothetical protein
MDPRGHAVLAAACVARRCISVRLPPSLGLSLRSERGYGILRRRNSGFRSPAPSDTNSSYLLNETSLSAAVAPTALSLDRNPDLCGTLESIAELECLLDGIEERLTELEAMAGRIIFKPKPSTLELV